MADKKITELVQIDTISSGDVFPIVDISDNITKKIDITQIKAQSPVQSVNSNIGAVVLTKTDIGLSNVDNTSDVNKPVSTAQQTALNLRVPYTGATSDVNLGEFGVQLGNIEFDTTPTNVPTTAGSLNWNDTDGTLDLKLKGGNVTLQIGQEQVVRVVNKTATSINLLEANYQAVRITGAIGQRAKVDLAQATNDVLSAETIGLVTETINNNQEGFITTSGLVRGINTTGSIQGETWADGDILYLSPTTAGSVTKVKPTAPNHLIVIGYVIYAHITQGTIFVKVDNGYELDELHNVKITTAANNNVLAYTSATDIWENKTVETALGFTPVVANSAITGATKTKITYDAKGLVTAGADATTADIAASTNKNYVTDAQATVIGNTSGTNTGNQTLANTSDATSHTVTLSATGGSVQLVEGSGITLTTTGTSADGIITIASTGGGSGTVTSVAALTLGTTGTDLSSSVANGTTTPVITLNVPTASATNRGALSSANWSTFNGKQDALVSGTSIKTVNSTSLLGSGDVAVQATLVSGTNIKTVNSTSLLGSGDITVQETITGAATTITTSDLTVSRALVSNASGKVAVATTTSTEIGYVNGVTSAIQTQIDTKSAKLITTNRQTASYTLVIGDADKLVEMNVATANNLTIPLNSSVAFATGTQILLAQYGAGQTTVVATSGVTIRSSGSKLKLNAQYSGATLIKIGSDDWYLFGDISA
jgi:hypothetical protein